MSFSCLSSLLLRRSIKFKNLTCVLTSTDRHRTDHFLSHHFHTTPLKKSFEDSESKELTVWSNVRAVSRSPVPALSLGLLGLIPFVSCPLYMASCGAFLPHIAAAHTTYGACILSFLGGVRWGFTIPPENPVQPDWVNLCYSVTPSLVAWGGLLLPSQSLSLATVMGGLLMAGYVDMAMYGYPAWFKGMRFLLTFIAVLSLWTTLVLLAILPAVSSDSSENH